MRRRLRRRERGVALLALLAVLALGASWYLVTSLRTDSGLVAARAKVRSAEALNRAKLALIGYIAAQAVKAGENNPGAFPCPEAPGYFGNASQEGQTASSCTLPAVGRFPWRTIGTDQLVDAYGEPLWYVVGTGWAYNGSNTLINSNSTGQLTVDGVANAAVALIIAPGPAIAAPASTGCAAWTQTRPTSGTPDLRNYLECSNATSPADATFVTTGPSGGFNDQVVQVTVADVMPAIEAAIASRVQREIVPTLGATYAGSIWGTSTSNPAFPFAAPFSDPSTATYIGQAGLTQGLMPFNYHSSSCGGNVRCSTNAISWGTPSLGTGAGPGWLPSSASCYVSGGTPQCEGYYYGGSLGISMSDPANGITTGLRTLSDVSGHSGTVYAWQWNGFTWVYLGSQAASVSRSLSGTGALNFVASATLPSIPAWGYYWIQATRVPDSVFGDSTLLDANNASTGWFARNEWFRLMYYAMAPGHAPGGSLSCTTGGTCLQVANMIDGTKQRAILIVAGRALGALSQTRPSSSLQNYLDNAENRNGDSAFTQSPVDKSFNDRFVSIAKN